MNQNEQMRELLKEARKIIRASSSRHLAKDWDSRATQALAAEPAPNTLGYVQGIEAAAKMLDTKAADYAGEFGFGDMGGLEFSREAQREYHSTLIELAEEVRSIKAAEPAQLVRLTGGEVVNVYVTAREKHCNSEKWKDPEIFYFDFANALQEAMIAKNGGKV